MRFPVSVKPFRGQLDVAAFAGVLMLLVMFLLLTQLVYTPGVRLELPVANDLPGTDRPTVAVAMVAVDSQERYYFENQFITGTNLLARLRIAVTNAIEPPTLIVQADKQTSYEMLIRLTMLAREAGIREARLATLPAPFMPPAASAAQP
jgi:biopolymer transport protein ExbD